MHDLTKQLQQHNTTKYNYTNVNNC